MTPENLSQRLMMLRQAIGDPADRPRYIEGVRGLGYRLRPAVTAESERVSAGNAPATAAGWQTPRAALAPSLAELVGYAAAAIVLAFAVGLARIRPTAAQQRRPGRGRTSFAVIPFANLSPSEEDQYFAFGLHQEIINQLVKVSDLTVISRTTMMRYGDGAKTPSR